MCFGLNSGPPPSRRAGPGEDDSEPMPSSSLQCPPPDDADAWDDPLEIHARRDPLPGAPVRVIVVAAPGPEEPDRIAEGLVNLLERLGRKAEAVVVSADYRGWNRAIERGLAGASQPLALISSASAPWTEAHLMPLLKAIDTCDHVVGRRSVSIAGRIGRWLAAQPWRRLFAVPVVDVHSPCRLHRLDRLTAIPLQSASAFVDVEILAKATFFGHLIDEVAIPALDGRVPVGLWNDFVDVFRRPALTFQELSIPAEQAQRQGEGADRPGREDQQGAGEIERPSPFQDDRAEAADELR